MLSHPEGVTGIPWNLPFGVLLQDKLETLNVCEITSRLFYTGITSPPQPLSLWHPVTNLPYQGSTLGTPPLCPSDSGKPLCLLPGIHSERYKHNKLMLTPHSSLNFNIIYSHINDEFHRCACYNLDISPDTNPWILTSTGPFFAGKKVFASRFLPLLQICFLKQRQNTHLN